MDRLAVLLGGRATEALTFGEVSTGGQNNLQRAADIARRLVKEYGMSQGLGALAFEPERRPVFLPAGDGLRGSRPYSEETAWEIDEEVKRIVDETEARLSNILAKREGDLNAIAQRFLDKEVLEGDDLRALLGDRQRVGEGRSVQESPGRFTQA